MSAPPSTPGPFRDGAVHVLDEKCSSCIFRPGNLMRLSPGRVRQMTRDSQAAGSAITCHATLPGSPTPPAVCRGYADLPATRALTWHRLATALDVLVYDPAPTKETP